MVRLPFGRITFHLNLSSIYVILDPASGVNKVNNTALQVLQYVLSSKQTSKRNNFADSFASNHPIKYDGPSGHVFMARFVYVTCLLMNERGIFFY